MNIGKTQTKAVINVSNQKYWKGQDRLRRTLEGNTDAEVLMFRSEAEVGAKPHHESMYGFKPKAFEKAYNMGFRKILWLDASMYVIKDLSPIFEKIEQYGYYWQSSGWSNPRWTTPEQKEYFGTDKGDMISSGVVGTDLDNEIGYTFFSLWMQAMKDGMFHFNHDVSRQDQSCASLIIEQMKLKITPNETDWMYGKPSETYKSNILIIADGIV